MPTERGTSQTKPANRLRREAGLFQVVTYGVGSIIGAGIYVLVGDASGLAGGMLWLAFGIGALIALPTGLAYAELSSMYPRTASEYVYVGRAYGSRGLSFIKQWMMLLTELVAAAAIALGFGRYLSSLVSVPVMPIAASVLVGLTAITMLGIKGSLRVNGVLSLVAIAGLLFVIIFGVHRIGVADYTSSPHGLSGIFGATALVFFAFIGFDNVANLSEETKQPERTIPRGLLIALGITTLLYVLIGLVAVSVVPWQELSASKAPLALVASKSLGHVAFDIVAITAMLTTLNTVLVQLLVSSRIVYGMGQEQALPGGFGRVSRRTSAPVLASGAAMLAALAFLSLGSVDVVAKVTSFGSLLTFAAVNLALLHLRRVAPHASRPFRVPLTIGWVSIPALLGLLSCLAMLTRFDWFSATLGLSLSLSGWLFYMVYTRQHSTEASAFHEPHETGPPGKAAGT